MAISLLSGILSALGVALAASPASATTTTACTTTAGGTTSTTATTTTFVDGVADTYTVSCYQQVGTGGTGPAYPSVAITSGTLPTNATFASGNQSTVCSTGNANDKTTTTSGSGTTEFYIIECSVAYTPPPGTSTAVPLTFTATPSACTGCTGLASGNLALNMTFASPTTPTCIDPATGGSAATFAEGATSTYTVECEDQSGVSGVAAYPSQIAIDVGSLTLASSQATFGGANQSTCGVGSGATTGTSGSGATEFYITECALSDAAVAGDAAGSPYNFAFQATNAVGVSSGNGTSGANSGTLAITVATAKAEACLDPASGGATTTFNSSAGGTANSYTVECYGESGVTGVTAYPTSISITAGTLPGTTGDANFAGVNGATTCNLGTGTTTTTSGSGTTEEYITECAITENAVSADNGTYTANFTPSTLPATQSGTLTFNVTGPSDVCLDPVSGGATTTFREGIANTYTVECYGTGFSSASANNYPASITANDVTPAGTFLDGTANFGGTAPPTACSTGNGGTTTTSGSGLSEEYILECSLTDTPSGSSTGSNVANFTVQPGSAGGTMITSGNLTVNDAPVTQACLDPAAAGSTTTMYIGGGTQSYTVECYGQSGISGETAYPTQISIASGAFPPDANPTLAGAAQTTCSTSSGGTTTTSGSGTTEEYILECSLGATPQADDAGTDTFTFSPTAVDGVNTITSGVLSVKVQTPTTTCSAPAAAGTTTTFTDGSSGSYSVTCYTQGFTSANAGNYPASINIASGSLPPQSAGITYGGSYQTTCSVSSSSATTTTSGSGLTEEYETVCKVAGTPVAGHEGTYPLTFTANPGSVAAADGTTAVTSGTLNLKLTGTAPTIHAGQYFNAVAGKPFCFDFAMDTTVTTTNGGLPLSSLTAGTAPANVTNYGLQNVSLAAGTAQICGTATSAVEGVTSETFAPVATNPYGSATGSIAFSAYAEANWTTSGGNLPLSDAGATATSLFDANQDIYQTGYQSAFGQPITGGVVDNNSVAREEGTITLVTDTSGQNTAVTSATSVGTATGLVGDVLNSAGFPPTTLITGATPNDPAAGQTTFTLSNNATTTEASGVTVQIYYNSSWYPVCTESGVAGGTNDCMIGGGGLGNSPTINTGSPLPTPVDPNATSTANLGSVDLDLGTDTSETYPNPPLGGCWGTANIGGSNSEAVFGTTDEIVMPSPWVAGGDCAYGTLGSNSASGDSPETPNENLCPPTQVEVDAGMVDCATIASSGNDDSGANTSFNYTTDDLFFAGQPVPQTSTVSLSSSDVKAGDALTITGGSNWWGAGNQDEPNTGCITYGSGGQASGVCTPGGLATYGDTQVGDFYPLGAPTVYIAPSSDVTASVDAHAATFGAANANAGPISSNVNIWSSTYDCTGTSTKTNGNISPCTLTVGGSNPNISPAQTAAGQPASNGTLSGQPTGAISGSFTVPSSLAAGTYNVYVDADNGTALPGNGPADTSSYPASPNGDTNPSVALGTDEAVAQIQVSGDIVMKTSSTNLFRLRLRSGR